MAGKIALIIIAAVALFQIAGWVGHQRQVNACADAYRHGNSSWAYAYEPSCQGVTREELSNTLAQH